MLDQFGKPNTDNVAALTQTKQGNAQFGLARVYIYLLMLISAGLLCLLVWAQLRWPSLHPEGTFPWASYCLLLVLVLLTEAYSIPISPGVEVSAGYLAYILSAAIAGPLACYSIAVASQLMTLRERQWEGTLCYTSTVGIVAGTSSLLYWGGLGLAGGFAQASPLVVALLGFGTGLLFQVMNYVLGVPVVWFRRRIGFRRLWIDAFQPILKFDLFFLVVSVGLVSIYHLFLPLSGGAATFSATLLVLLCLVPVVALVWALRQWATERVLAVHNKYLADRNQRLAQRNERLALQAVASQITALDLKDNYTARHSASVAQWARDIAAEMGLSQREQNLAHLAGVLHDVGKIGVPDDILKSSERLNADNWAQIERHCENGYKVLCAIDQFEELATVVLHHHERYDGNGYPKGLAGEEIPLISRIICVADSYSAMTSNRPYGPPLSVEVATSELEYKKGSQFDSGVVDAFLTVLEQHDEAYQRGLDVDFDTEVHRIRFLQDLPIDLGDMGDSDELPAGALLSGEPAAVGATDPQGAEGE